MAFPTTPLGVRVDLMVDTEWVDITTDVRVGNGITIKRGLADEGGTGIEPSSCNLTLQNPAGKYSPRNPESPYFGKIGRNTPIRVGIGAPPIAGSTFSTVDSSSLVAPSVTAESAGRWIVAYAASPSAALITAPAGFTTDAAPGGTIRMRTAHKAQVAGATGTATATTAATATSWAALSVHVPGGAAPTPYSTYDDNDDVSVTPTVVAGDYLVAICGWESDPDGNMPAPADYYYNDGNGWSLLTDTGPNSEVRLAAWGRRCDSASAQVYLRQAEDLLTTLLVVYKFSGLTDLYVPRFTGEVSEWPSRWNLAETDVTVPLQAYGITRRLNQGEQAATSVLRQWIPSLDGDLVAYWPMEDEVGATGFSSAVSGGSAMVLTGSPVLAANSEAAVSAPLPTMAGATATGLVPAYTAGLAWNVGCLVTLPDTGMANGNILLTVTTSGTVVTWKVSYLSASGGGLLLQGFNLAGSLVVNTSFPTIPALDGTSFYLFICGSVFGGITALLGWSPVQPTSALAKVFSAGAFAGSLGSVLSVKVGDSTITGEPAFGHVAVVSRVTNNYGTFFADSAPNDVFTGWNGEEAGERIARLLLENGIQGRVTYGSVSEAMGSQSFLPVKDLINQCAATDGGVLFEPPGFVGIAYRERTAFESTSSVFTLNYAADQISAPFEPTDDDQHIANDVTVQRIGGLSARYTVDTGPLSTQLPPLGVGRYKDNPTLSLGSDSQVLDQAAWHAHLGTWDATRFPAIRVDLAANPSLVGDLPMTDIGCSFTLLGLPDWVFSAPEDDDQYLIVGMNEVLGYRTWSITYNTMPWGPFRTVTLNDSQRGRLDAEGSTLTAAANTTSAIFNVSTAAGFPLWTTTATRPTDFPFNINVDDEEMTVTSIAGVTSPQTFWVTRSTNGIVKTHAAGATVSLAQPNYLALS